MEALRAVLPIVGIVLALSFTIAPISPSVLLCFLLGAVLVIVGMMFFTLGAEIAMTPMGERMGGSRSGPVSGCGAAADAVRYPLAPVLMVLYAVFFVLAFLVPQDFWLSPSTPAA